MSSDLQRYAWISIAAALATISLKTLAWLITGSVGMLADALESLVNLAAALLALWMLRIAAAPPDDAHPHGHSKAEYFSSGSEGALIVLAAAAIAYTSLPRLFAPQPIDAPALGIVVSVLASVINFGTAKVLLAAGRRHHSVALVADARHLMTDVWTTAGVLGGVALVAATGWLILDPLLALAVAAHIVWIGAREMRRSFAGLMDAAIGEKERQYIDRIQTEYARRYQIAFHALRTRQAGARRFVSFHMLVPDEWSVARAHQLSEEIEARIRELVPNATILTHIEPISEPASYDDIPLDR